MPVGVRSIPRRGDHLNRHVLNRFLVPLQRAPWLYFSMRRMYRCVYRAYRCLLERFAYGYSVFEYWLLLLPNLREIRGAEFVYPLTFVSFGHQASDLHMVAMRFPEKQLIAFVSDYRNFNRSLVRTFEDVVKIRYIRHTWLAVFFLRFVLKYDEVRQMRIRAMRSFVRMVRSRADVLIDCNTKDRPRIEGRYATEYISLLEHSPPTLSILKPPDDAISEFRSILHSSYPQYTDTWFVSLYLRRKYIGKPDVRDTNPDPYDVVIDRIRALGGFILCGGDYDPHAVFVGKEDILGYEDFPCSRELCDLYFLSQPRFLVCTHSGPLVVAMVFNVPSLITNSAFFYQSGSRENNRVIYKRLREIHSGRILCASETFTKPIVEYEEGRFMRAGLEHVDNTEAEIAAALEEMIDLFLLKNPSRETEEDRLLLERFRNLLPYGCTAHRTPARPTLHYLRTLVW